MKKATPHCIIVCFLLLIPFLSHAEIKNGYWMGFTLRKDFQERITPNFEEWFFEDDSVRIRKIDDRNEPSRLLVADWIVDNDEIILSGESWDEDLFLGLQSSDDMLTLKPKDDEHNIYLFYLGKKRDFLPSDAKAFISDQLFEIDRPDLLYHSDEVEFWDDAIFYENGVSKCVHHYKIIEVGKYTFMFFGDIMPLRILSYDDKQIHCERINDFKKLTFTRKEVVNKLDIKLFSGKWKWKSSDKKPNMNTYTISVGYQMHELIIKNDGLIEWLSMVEFTEDMGSNIVSIHPTIIPENIADRKITYNRNAIPHERSRKHGEIPHIKFSPSGQVILLESCPMKNSRNIMNQEGQMVPREHIWSNILLLQYIHHTEDRIYFKYANTPYYVTLIRVGE